MKELQELDCNCNNCIFMVRDLEKKTFWDSTELHKNQKNASHRIHYGRCIKQNKDVSSIPNTCQLETQQCFKNRK